MRTSSTKTKRLPPWEEIARASMMRRIAEVADLTGLRSALRDDRTRFRFLERLRWPAGFVCARCKARNEPQRPRPGMCLCTRCGYFRNVTSDSPFRDGRISLERWLSLYWLLASGALPLSVDAVARLLRVDDPEAQHILDDIGKLLMALERRQLGGVVELDEAVLDVGELHPLILVAVETFDEGFGRVRLKLVNDVGRATVRSFIEETIHDGALVRTDCWSDYLDLQQSTYMHEPVPPSEGVALTGPAVALRLLRRYLALTPATSRELLQVQLAAFTLRFNRAHRFTTGEVFGSLISATLQRAERATRTRIVSGVRPRATLLGGAVTPKKEEAG